MFTIDEIVQAISISGKYEKLEDRLGEFCLPVAEALGFDNVIHINMDANNVSFIAEWNGQYQSHNEECFSFPVELLTKNAEAVIEYLRPKPPAYLGEYMI